MSAPSARARKEMNLRSFDSRCVQQKMSDCANETPTGLQARATLLQGARDGSLKAALQSTKEEALV